MYIRLLCGTITCGCCIVYVFDINACNLLAHLFTVCIGKRDGVVVVNLLAADCCLFNSRVARVHVVEDMTFRLIIVCIGERYSAKRCVIIRIKSLNNRVNLIVVDCTGCECVVSSVRKGYCSVSIYLSRRYGGYRILKSFR